MYILFIFRLLRMAQPIHFSDLPTFVIMHIFSFLNAADMSSMLDVDERNREIALNELRLGNHVQHLILRDCEKNIHALTFQDGKLIARGLRICLRILRIFGNGVERLEFYAKDLLERRTVIVGRYINLLVEHNKLRSLIFRDIVYDITKDFKYQFTDLIELVFVDCIISHRMCRMASNFPNLTRLRLGGEIKIESPNLFLRVFPKMQTMMIGQNSMSVENMNVIRDLNFHVRIYHGVEIFSTGRISHFIGRMLLRGLQQKLREFKRSELIPKIKREVRQFPY